MRRLHHPLPLLLGLATGAMFLGIEFQVGVKLRPFDILMGAALFLALAQPQTRPSGVRMAPFVWAAVAYGLYLLLNGALLTSPLVGSKEALQLGFFLVFCTLLSTWVQSDDATILFARTAILSLALVALWNAGAHISNGVWSGWKSLDEPKLTHSLIIVFLASLVQSFRVPRLTWSVILAVALVLLVLSGERKGWVAAGAGVAALMIFAPSSKTRPILLIGALCGLAGILTLIAPSVPYLDKQIRSATEFTRFLASDVDPLALGPEDTTISNRARLVGLSISREMYASAPFFGIGLDKYKSTVEALPVPDYAKKGAHNEVLRIAAELGTTGLILYGLLHVILFARLFGALRQRRHLAPLEAFRLRLGIGTLAYGAVANLFLGGGGVNLFLVFLPAGLLFSLPLFERQRGRDAHVARISAQWRHA